jgi:alpha-beta hydrolase superfamily lysophospholipase
MRPGIRIPLALAAALLLAAAWSASARPPVNIRNLGSLSHQPDGQLHWTDRGAPWRAPTVRQEMDLQLRRIREGWLDPRYRSQLHYGPRRRVALLFHGNRGRPYQLRRISLELRKAGYIVYMPANPGAGKLRRTGRLGRIWRRGAVPDSSEFPNARHPDEDRKFVDMALRKARRLAGPRGKIYVAGLSRGSTMAAYAALAHPDQVERLVLYSPFCQAQSRMAQNVYKVVKLLDRLIPDRVMAWTLDHIPLMTSKTSKWRNHVGNYYALFGFGEKVLDLSRHKLKVPTQIFTTAHEKVVSRQAISQLFQSIGGRGAGHSWKEFGPQVSGVDHDLVDPKHSNPDVAAQVARWTRQFFDGVGQARAGVHAPPRIMLDPK